VTRHVVPEDRGRFAEDLFATELDAMRGRRTFADVLDEVCARWPVEERHALAAQWRRVEVDAGMVRLVRRLRATGTTCHLVTNQNDERAAYLRTEKGYDALFDRVLVSCDLGLTKSDDGFYRRVVEELGTPPGDLLVVDDSAGHVAAARAAGLRAERWSLADDRGALRRLLADHGVRVDVDA
jgi:putative hydrolase of the HAD superfamily